ncbi:MAG TPA: hypothetical protein VGM31_17475 [Puia sp.]|jgi:hypothetical protein
MIYIFPWFSWVGGSRRGMRTAVNMTDIAPTVAALLHIQAPNGSIGQPMVEVVGDVGR